MIQKALWLLLSFSQNGARNVQVNWIERFKLDKI